MLIFIQSELSFVDFDHFSIVLVFKCESSHYVRALHLQTVTLWVELA